ncbi:glycosyltransferase [bacterium]|nr:glycosyltransferase [bacterium]
MNKITFCIPSKNNLRYLKSSISSIKKNSLLENEIIVWVDSDNDGTEDWLKENNIKYLVNPKDSPQGIAAGYNRCIEAAENEIVCMFHADMFMGKGFDKNLIKHLKPNLVISGTRIEPPLHPVAKEKIIKDFGLYPEDFKEKEFNEFVEKTKEEQEDKITYGIFAPWACFKSKILQMGMHDEKFHSYHEDSDIFQRFLLKGMKVIQSRDALVYHLTCRGGKWIDGIEQVTNDNKFHSMTKRAQKHYLKKWGSWIKNDEYQHPILSPVYRKKIIINNENVNANLISLYDWFNGGEDIIITIDGNTFNQQDFQYITQLNDIIADSGEVGEFKLGNIQIKINKIEDISKTLIKYN